MKIYTLLTSALMGVLAAMPAAAEAPASYYRSCENLGGRNLLLELHDVIDNHTVVSYDGLWTVYGKSDVRDDGTIWDMYSTKKWRFGGEKCGNYKYVGDCYNREHSMPKSWFNEGSPMKSDAFHVYPTDGKVNGQRSNYPYGECSGGTNLGTHNGVKALGRLGKSTFSGYSGTVFEPDDEYKGDLARTYFYMATRYNDKISAWTSDMLAKNSYPAFTTWAVNLLLKWHRQDPVSDKERERNDAVYSYQKNRNPFIDHPEMVEYIWGNRTSQRWTLQSGLDETPTDSIEFNAVSGFGSLTLSHNSDAAVLTSVYGIDGALRWHGQVEAGEALTLELTAGVYLVRHGATVHRLLVK